MLRKAFVDDQLAARQFNTGETVRKSGLRGHLLSPYAGRVLYSNVDTGVVQVQWPWGADLEFASELVHDVSFTLRPPSMDQSYSTWEGARNINDSGNVESDAEWRNSLASTIVAGYEELTLPLYRAACKAMHEGLDEVAAFVTVSKDLAGQFGTDAVRRTVANLYEAGRRMAIYWVDPSRQYRVTQKEKNGGVLACPRCKGSLKPRKYRQGKTVLLCKGCGFTIHPKDLQKWRYRAVVNLLRIASNLEKTDPILAYELERSALAVVNPGARKFEDHVGDLVDVLKGLKAELEKADQELDTDDAKEFAKFFDEEAKAQSEDLRQMLKVSARLLQADDTAGIMDKVKGLFKKKDKKKEPETEEKPAGYQMSEREQDEFVEGDRDWTDGAQKVEKETKENKEFFEDAKSVQTLIDRIREKPSRSIIRTIIQDLGDLIDRGTKLMKGQRKVDDAMSHKDVMVDDDAKPAAKKAPDTKGLPNTITHYMSLLNDIEGDDAKLVKTLKEFFSKVKPFIEEDRASLASRTANKPSFRIPLRDKGQSGRDNATIHWDKGWTWTRRDPKGEEHGFSRSFLEPAEILRDIENYAAPGSQEAAKAAAYFDELAKQEPGAAVTAAIVHCAAAYPALRSVLLPLAVRRTARTASARKAMLPKLVRMAHSNPAARSVLLPVIRSWSGR